MLSGERLLKLSSFRQT